MRIAETLSKWLESYVHLSSIEETPEPEYYVPLMEPDMVLEFEREALEEARNRGLHFDSYSIRDFEGRMEAIRTAAVTQQYNENVRLWIWSLVHSKSAEHVEEGKRILSYIPEIEGVRWVTVRNYMLHCPITKEEQHYFYAVAYYNGGHHLESLYMLDKCLQVDPTWKPALSLQELVEHEMTKAGSSVVFISASILGAIAGCIFGAVSPGSFLYKD